MTTMGGRIWAKARPEGGAEFGFSLPTYPDELEPGLDDAAEPKTATTAVDSSSNGSEPGSGAAKEPKAATPA